jgi:hypothetical protein
MMFDDPIVEDIRRVRRAHASQFDNDLGAIVADLRRLERESGRTYVSFAPRLLHRPSGDASAGQDQGQTAAIQ